MTLPTLHQVSYCFYLAGLVAALLTSTRLWWLSRRNSGKALSGWSGTASSRLSGEAIRKVQVSTIALFAASLITFAHLTVREFHRENPVQLRDVRVLSRSGDTFRMDVRNPRTQERDQFTVRFCSEVTREIQPGITFVLLQYREDMHNQCFEVDRSDEGYVLLRRENNEPVLTAFDRE